MIYLITLLQVIKLLFEDLLYLLWYFKPRDKSIYVKQTNGIVRRLHRFDNKYHIKTSTNKYKTAFTHQCKARVDLGKECISCRI